MSNRKSVKLIYILSLHSISNMLYSIPAGLSYSQYCDEFKVPKTPCFGFKRFWKRPELVDQNFENYTNYLKHTGAEFTCLSDFIDLFDIPDDYDYAKETENRVVRNAAESACDYYKDMNDIPNPEHNHDDIPVINPNNVSKNYKYIYPKLPDMCNKLAYLRSKIYSDDGNYIYKLTDIMTHEEKMFFHMFWDDSEIYFHTGTTVEFDRWYEFDNCIVCSNWTKEDCTTLLYVNPGDMDHMCGFSITPQLFIYILERFYDGKIPESFGFGWFYDAYTQKWGEGNMLEVKWDPDDPYRQVFELIDKTGKERFGIWWDLFDSYRTLPVQSDPQSYSEELESHPFLNS